MLRKNILSQAVLATKYLQKSILASRLQGARWATTVAVDKETLFENEALAKARPLEDIPSFLSLPFLGTSWIYLPIIGLYKIREQHKAIADKHRRFGDIFKESVGSINIVVTVNPDDMLVLYKHEGPYPFRGEFTSLKAYRESRKQWYSSTGLLILQGKEWKDLRSKTQKHLMKPRAIQAYLSPMQDVARDLVKKIMDTRDSNKEVPDFLRELYKWGLESVAIVSLDTRLGCLDKNLSPDSDGMKMINSVQTQFECMNKLEAFTGNIQFWKLFPTPTWRRFTKTSDVFTEIAYKYINRSLEELKKNAGNDEKEMTLLQSMLMTKGLDVSGVMVTVTDVLMGGIDTTSHSVGFLLYHMAKNPEKQERLYQEITKLLPRKEDRITNNVFNELKYLKACIKESQRLCPVISGIARSLDHDVVISGYRVPAGTIVYAALHQTQIDERYFTNATEYIPERWLSKDDKFHPFAFVPFGIGIRSCVGRRLAELEIICLTTELIRNFKVTYLHENIDMFTRLINAPDKPLRFNFIER